MSPRLSTASHGRSVLLSVQAPRPVLFIPCQLISSTICVTAVVLVSLVVIVLLLRRLLLLPLLLIKVSVLVVAFSSNTRILGEGNNDESIPASVFRFPLFQVEIGSRTSSPLFKPRSVHDGSAS